MCARDSGYRPVKPAVLIWVTRATARWREISGASSMRLRLSIFFVKTQTKIQEGASVSEYVTGTLTVNVLPLPTSLSTLIVPPGSSANRLLRVRLTHHSRRLVPALIPISRIAPMS